MSLAIGGELNPLRDIMLEDYALRYGGAQLWPLSV